MRFEDPSQDEDTPLRPVSIVPPPDRTSRAIRTKLLMLFAMLVMVIVLMKEAGKPERWEWMGFETPKAIEMELDDARPLATSIPTESDRTLANSSGNQSSLSATPEPDPPVQSSRPITISANQFGSARATNPAEPVVSFARADVQADYPVAAVEFWNSLFRRLKPDQQTTLVRLLKYMRLGVVLPEDQQPAARQLVRLLRSHREQFHQTLFDQLALAADGTPEKNRLADEMYESQAIWDKKIAPAIDAASRGVDFTIAQRQAVVRLQQVLDPLLYERVQDRTSLGWTGDSAAWIRIWEKVKNDEMPTGRPVTRIELMGQPQFYRGQPVVVEGWVRSASRKTLGPESELGIPCYYVLWIRPRETKLGPYCVYSMTLPDGFPSVTESFSDVNEHVRVSGYSFKIRNYVAADSSVDECPVIIAPGLERVVKSQFTSVNRWQPSRSTLTFAFILIPLLASGLAWLAFRTSRTRQYVPGATSQQRIDQALNNLVNDPRVQTEREKVMSLYESETHDQ